ncbi:MAG: hypothetical protein IJS01_15025 [Lentisphaeria bacterium]|nr:hypothetical protein [Lentisphaeria bacterium]
MLLSIAKKGQSLLLLSFALFALAGTLLLKLPGMTLHGDLAWIDAFFMATSATCITGLATVPVTEFTLAGQIVLAVLVQIGGIGIMTLSASILLSLGKGLSFSDTLLISSINDNFSLRGTEGLTRIVLKYSLFTEGAGAAVIYVGCLLNGGDWLKSLWEAVFVAVSSFCNAGFTPYADSMASQHALSKIGCAALIVFGGLGVYVIYDLLQVVRKKQNRLRVHSKVVLLTTAVLLIAGTVILKCAGLQGGVALNWSDAAFLSVSCRTAGFSTFEIGTLSDAGLLSAMILMLIGASPGSTGGGMKTSTVAVAAAAIWNTFLGNTEVLMFKRMVPGANVLRAFSIIVIFLLLTYTATMVMQILAPRTDMTAVIFESISALTTTGLSMNGTTSSFLAPAKFMLAVFMYIGRMGPFTIMLFLLSREKRGQLKYPQERIIIG